MHINFRHKAQLHIKTLITHLVVEKNVLTIETLRDAFVSANLHLRPIAGPEHLLPNLSSCIEQNVVGRTSAFLLNRISRLPGRHTQGLRDTEFRCIVLERSGAWKTPACLQLFSEVQTLEAICTHSSRLGVEGLGCRSP